MRICEYVVNRTNMLALGRRNAMHDDGAIIGYDEIDASVVMAGVVGT